MKRLKLLLLLVTLGFTAHSQLSLIKIVSFTVKNQLPGIVDNWVNTPGALMLTAQKAPTAQMRGVKLVVQIRSGGAIVCGSSTSNAKDVDPFEVRSFTTAELLNYMGNCSTLKDGTYSICAQFINIDRIPISQEVCKDFTVENPKETDYAPPTLITPDNGKIFSAKDMLKPVIFRWTPLVPKPKEPVTYRIKVWQLMQGQNGTAAMRSNQPIIEKEVKDQTQSVVANFPIGPCKPPYLCDFVWSVQAVNREGKPIGRNNGTSESYTFKVNNNDIDIQIDSFSVSCCNNGIQNVYIKLKNNLANAVNITQLKIDKVNGSPNIIPIGGLTPPLVANIPGNGSQVFTGTIKCIDSAKVYRLFVGAEDALDNAITETEVEADTLHCKCDACDEKHFSLNAPTPTINWANNSISFAQPITVTSTPAKTIKSIQANLVYFEMVPENDLCIPCNKDAATYGHFANASNVDQWNGNQQSVNINITTPQLVPCCSATFKWCIRYKIEFTDCTSCSKLVCYEKKKEGCTGVNPNHPNDQK